MTYATTFSGIGGWELGLNACGWELKWQCESDPFCRTVLQRRFGVPVFTDIRTLCEQNPAPVDALIGSPPCQPFSTRGEGEGLRDERHLFPFFRDTVCRLKPQWVLMENVVGLFTTPDAFSGYTAGLASLGYDVLWHCIPASAVGAPHRRNRVWIIAHANGAMPPESIGARRRRTGSGDNSLSENPWPDSDEEVLKPGFCFLDDGIPKPVDELSAFGNAVVPQIPFLIGQAINEIERSH